ncbi:uncharacterized protein [Diadema setosum]|uniref:uncharacterized protein n=1 Tax=Diadema setosum TaxID=31175 RepID=UPI003B3AD8C4
MASHVDLESDTVVHISFVLGPLVIVQTFRPRTQSPDDRGEPLVVQILKDDLDSIRDIKLQNHMIDNVRDILKEFETGSTTRGSSGSCMMQSSKTTESQVQKERIRKLCRSTKSRLNRLGERDERHLRDKCELRIFQSVVEPQKSVPPKLSINEENLRNISNKSQLRPEELNELSEHLEFILKVAVKPDEERYHITQFILAAHEQDRKCQTANTRGSGVSTRYDTAVPQQDTPNGRIARFWVEKIMNIGDSNIQFHVYTSICDYM